MVVGGAAGVPHARDHHALGHPLAHLHLERGVVIVGGVDAVLLAVGAYRGVVTDGDGERPLLGPSGIDHLARTDGVYRRAVRIVELDALMLLKVPAHGGTVAVGLVDVGVVGRGDWAAEPDGERIASANGVLALLPDTRQRVGHRTKPAGRALDQLPPDEERIGRRERGRGDRLADPAGWRVPETLVAPEGSDGPAPGVGRHSAHVLTHQNGKDAVGGTLGRRTGFVADGGPPLAIVGGDLETV